MKILLVDDHAIVRSGLRNLLMSVSNPQVSEAATGREAMLRLRQDRPDLVLLDLNLPGIGGLELLRKMLLEDKTTRILVLSMHAEPLYAARAMELGARGYLSKNASADELLTAVRRVLEGGRYIENEIAQELALQTATPGAWPAGPYGARSGDHAAAGRRHEPGRNRGCAWYRLQDGRQRVQPYQGETRRDADERSDSAGDVAGCRLRYVAWHAGWLLR